MEQLTKEQILEAIYEANPDVTRILENIDEAKYDFVDEEDIEEHGDLYEAYNEVGRGEAESAILQDILLPYKGQECLKDLDTYCEIWDDLCGTWDISTN